MSIVKLISRIELFCYLKTMRIFLISFLLLFLGVYSCDFKKSDSAGGQYVKPTITRTGKFRKGYFRKKVSTDKNALKNQNRSTYYYRTRGKYLRRK